MLNWRVASPNTVRSYQTAANEFQAVTGIPVDQADAASIAGYEGSMWERGLSVNTIRARLSAVAVLSGIKVQLPKKSQAEIRILDDDQLKAFFRKIEKDADRQLMVQILLTGRRPQAQFHWLSIPKLGLTTQEITRKIKRYARLAGLNDSQVNMRALVQTGRDLTGRYDAEYIVEHILPRPARPTVEWKPLHGMGRRSRHSVRA